MTDLNTILLNEIDDFRQLGHKFLAGEVTKMDFKGASGGMGVYAHRDSKEFMIRFRIPSGIASLKDLKLIYAFAKRYNLTSIHLTTRQAIQLHGLNIDEICDAMKEGIENGLYSRGSGGNFPRNVAISPLSGVDNEEAFDVSPYALAVGNHFLNKVYTYKLPRKLKVSFSSSDKDYSHTTVTDLGFLAVKNEGKEYFKVYLGGGLGRNSRVSAELPELVEPKDVLYHIEAMTKLFINEGDYVNKGKARIRYILERMGKDKFIQCYKAYLDETIKNENLELSIENTVYNKPGVETSVKSSRLIAQKQHGLYSVYVQPIGGILALEDLKTIINEVENIGEAEIRLAMTEGLYIRNLNGTQAEKILELTKKMGGETRLEQSVACIGVPTCQIGVLESQGTLKEIVEYFRKNNFSKDILPSVHISGCPNSCGVHEIGEIGLCGKIKKVNDESKSVFELHLGGRLGVSKTTLGSYCGDILKEEVPEFLLSLAKYVDKTSLDFYTCLTQNKDDIDNIVNEYLV